MKAEHAHQASQPELVCRRAALFLLLGLAACLPGETVEARYATYEAAAAAGAMEQGWIPLWLPQGAIDIHEKHNLDSNASILRFDTVGAFNIPDTCEPARELVPASLTDRAWWPEAMPPGSRSFICDGGFLRVDAADTRIYFWRP